MAWFWGSSSKSGDDSEYDSDEYTDGEYSDDEEEYEEYTDEEAEAEEEAVDNNKEGDQQDKADEKEEEDDDDEKKEMDEEPITEKEENNDQEKEEDDDEEESFVEVTQEDASSPKVADVQPEKEEAESKTMRTNSLLDAAESADDNDDEEEEVSSIVETEDEEDAKEDDHATSKDTTEETEDHPPPTVEVPDDKESDQPAEEEEEEDQPVVQVETVSSDDGSEFSDDDSEEEEELTSFADKQSMLLLAAEHDRVDILRAILTGDENTTEEEEEIDTNALMNTGIPPLHVAISFGSTNTTQSLLRMGADPSIRPNVEEVQKHYKSHQSKVEIKNMGRFDGITAWELAFGNEAYAKLEASGVTKKSSWVFGSAIQPVDGDDNNPTTGTTRVICPLDNIPAAKKEGIKHAFTAEALRCLGGDELDRLLQLVDSGMPATTEIAEKDLYQWAVEMGALKCEEYLRPVEAAKHTDDGETAADPGTTTSGNETKPTEASISNARVLDRSRPGEDESCSQLKNKLVELDSLATALSTCVDNLAEEVSVCHGLLLMNGGASALASHVKSLKAQKATKEDELNSAYLQLDDLEEKLSVIAHVAGSVGKEVLALSDAELKQQQQQESSNNENSAEDGNNDNNDDHDDSEDSETEREELLQKIEASEAKIRKLRISITDLSEESARDLKEVERRGLSGGIDLVRGLRDEIRDVEFQLTEAKSLIASRQARISLIRARVSPETQLPKTPPAAMMTVVPQPLDTDMEPSETEEEEQEQEEHPEGGGDTETPKSASEKIATGDSQAIAVRAPGNQGFFRIDLWQVILRIIGMNRAADRRALEVAAQRQRHEQKKKQMTLGVGVFETKRPEPIHVMTV